MMTENNILNLPTYEQVEKVKDVVVNTGGMTIDIDNKKYKAVMNKDRNFVTGYGDGGFAAIQSDYETKFPDHYAKFHTSLVAMPRNHIGNNIFILGNYSSTYSYFVIDMNTMTCLQAYEITDPNFKGFYHNDMFQTPNHILVRCLSWQSSAMGWAVLEKDTYRYIRTIGELGSVGYPPDWPKQFIVGHSVPYRNGNFYMIASSEYNNLRHFKLEFDALGIPTGYRYHYSYGFSSSSSNSNYGRTMWMYGDFIYIVYSSASNQYMITKKPIDSNNSLGNGPIVAIAATAPNTMATWQEFIMVGSVPWILVQFGEDSGALTIFINIDTMSASTIATSNSWPSLTFDYVNKDRFIVQYYTMAGERFNDVPCEFFHEFTLNKKTGSWGATAYFTQLRSQITAGFGDPSSNKESWQRRLYFEQYGFYKDGKWHCRIDNRYSATLGPIYYIDGYKEVIE